MRSRKTPSEALSSLQQELRVQAARSVMFHATVAARLGISVTDLNCLNILSLDGPQAPGLLADRLGITRGGAVTAMIDRLEAAGFVRRTPDTADRRRVAVELAGMTAVEMVSPLFADLGRAVDETLDRYSTDEVTVLLRFATELNNVVLQATARLRDDTNVG